MTAQIRHNHGAAQRGSAPQKILMGVVTSGSLLLSLLIGPAGTAAVAPDSTTQMQTTEAHLESAELQKTGPQKADSADSMSTGEGPDVSLQAPVPEDQPASPEVSGPADKPQPPATSSPASPSDKPEADSPQNSPDAGPVEEEPEAKPDVPEAQTPSPQGPAAGTNAEDEPNAALLADSNTPYLTWEVQDENDAHIGGASFTVEGPRGSGDDDVAWSGVASEDVQDCVEQDCRGLDQDPLPGKFQVESLGDQSIDAAGRYRIQPATDPAGYSFVDSDGEQGLAAGRSAESQGTSENLWTDSAQEGDFGTFMVIQNTGTKEIVVRKRVLANPSGLTSSVSTNIGANNNHTVGAVFKLYENTGNGPGAPTEFTCTVAAGGQCTITVTGVENGGPNFNKRFWVVEESPVGGSPAANTYGNPMLYVGDYNGPKSPRPLVGLTQQLTTSSSTPIYMPMTASNVAGGTVISNNEIVQSPRPTIGQAGSFGAVANSLNNPSLVPKCEAAPLRIALILDESASISGPQWTQFRSALVGGNDSVLGLLSGADARVSILGFGTNTNWHFGAAGPQTLPTNYASLIPNSRPGGTSNTTNWDAALSTIQANASSYDMVLFVTDGAPNTILGGTQVDGYNVTLRSLEAPIYASNAIKDAGVRVVAVGVGNGAAGGEVAANLRAVSGSLPGSDYLQGDWEGLKRILTDIVKAATCTVPVEVTKTEVRANGTTVTNAGGWTFSAAVIGPGSSLQGDGTQTTVLGPAGTATWGVKFTQPAGQTAQLTLSETPQPGWALTGAACTVGGQPTTVDVANNAITLPGITTTSESVKCTFTNTQAPPNALLTLKKIVNNQHGGTGEVANWTLQADGPTNGVSGITGDSAVTAREVDPGTYLLSETGLGGYTASEWSCQDGSKKVEVTGAGAVKLAAGDEVTCKITNSDVAGAVIWSKVDADDESVLLGGSEWTLTGPAGATSTVQEVTDCVGNSETDCAGSLDKDPGAGQFQVEGLEWGTYSLLETTAPPGYVGSQDPVTFVISPNTSGISEALVLELAPIKNARILGTVAWLKVAEHNPENLLSGSEWKLIGPAEVGVQITDCIGSDASACAGLQDQDPEAGRFLLQDLPWGAYTLEETKAPAGYELDSTPIEFVIGPDADEVQLGWELGQITNKQQTGPNLPLTGGVGSQIFLLIGGSALVIALGMTTRRRRKGVTQTL